MTPKDCDLLIDNQEKLFEFVRLYVTPNDGVRRIYRGERLASYRLIPGIGRHRTVIGQPYTEDDEDRMFRHFKQRAHLFVERNYDDLSLWVLAQHHGLPTRLLDWSFNPLVAAYFATEHKNTESEECSAIFVFENYPKPTIGEQFKIRVPKLRVFSPTHLDTRVISQRGLFTVHPYPWDAIEDKLTKKVCIAPTYRRELRKLINVFGVNESAIYPGLDGLSRHLKWMMTDVW